MSSDSRVSRILCKKYRKISRKIAPDRISNLPDCVLSHILSLLPTKDVVRTSVLSKDWEYKWTSVCNIDINDKDQFSKKKSSKTSFAKFVEKLLLLTDDIESFHFECQEKHGVGRLTTWIFSVLRRNIRSLRVVYGESGIILPRKLLSCNSLEKLELVLPCTFKVLERVCFGSLTTLHLEGVSILNENWIVDSLMFDFPVLVKFTIRKCKWLNVKRVEISAPKMRSFVIETPDGAAMNDYPIKITGQSLEKFESCGGLPENIVLSGGSRVVSAALLNRATTDNCHLLEKTGLQVREMLNEFSNAYGLKLSFSVAYAIHLSTRLARAVSLPTFCNLEELVICGWAGALVELLHVTPSLKCLKINMRWMDDYNYDDEEYVPSCFQSHLEEVKFDSFSGSKHDFKLGKYLLENAAKLKKLFISNGNGYLIPKNKIAEELSTYSKVSTCLTVFVL